MIDRGKERRLKQRLTMKPPLAYPIEIVVKGRETIRRTNLLFSHISLPLSLRDFFVLTSSSGMAHQARFLGEDSSLFCNSPPFTHSEHLRRTGLLTF